jgi:hypothetical protein
LKPKPAARKALGIPPADIHHRVSPRTDHGVLRNGIPHPEDFIHKHVTKACFPGLIPTGSLSDALPNLRPEFHMPDHLADLERSDAFMSARENTRDATPRFFEEVNL